MDNWKYKIGQHVVNSKRDIIILDHKIKYFEHYKKPYHEKWYKIKCNKCGWDKGWVSQKSISQKGCGCCSGRIVVPGINDVATTDPHVICYLVNQEDAYKYTRKSSCRIQTRCPVCGSIKNCTVANLISYPYACYNCGKHVSLPERFMVEFFKMYDIDFIPQFSSKNAAWVGKYRYDYYLPKTNTIVEVNGKQHYESGIHHRTLEEIQNIDTQKIKLAINNGVKHYCIIPLIYSTKEYMIDALMHNEIIDFLKINRENLKDNLEICFIKACKNQTLQICECYALQPTDAHTLAERFHVSVPTILKALHIGTQYGLCAYNGKEYIERAHIKSHEKSSIKIIATNCDGTKYIFPSLRAGERLSDSILGFHMSRFLLKKFCNNQEECNGWKFIFSAH